MFGLTTKINGFILTRDSWLWLWGKVLGIAGLVATGTIDPATLGLTEKQSKLVMGLSAALLAGSAKLSTSPLPGKPDAEKVTAQVKES